MFVYEVWFDSWIERYGGPKHTEIAETPGKAKYEDMTAEEKTVIDDFEGAAEYRKVMSNREYFIQESVGLMMLEGPKAS